MLDWPSPGMATSNHCEMRYRLRMIRGEGERDGAAPVVARDSEPCESQVPTQQLVDVGRDRPLVVAAGGPGRIGQTAQVRHHEAVLVLQLCDHLAASSTSSADSRAAEPVWCSLCRP